ncbi:MAG: hypothetical protein ACRDTR_21895, partial [Rubrobacter sp.]
MGKRLRRYLILALVAAFALGLAPAAGLGQAGGGYRHLQPGERADLAERVPVNIVFVGYDPNDVGPAFRAGLPSRYKPIVRSEYAYDKSVERSLLGLDYTYDYNIKFAGEAYEERLFRYLSDASKPAPLTDFQKLYNGDSQSFCERPREEPQCQTQGVRDIESNHRISAPAVEEWL